MTEPEHLLADLGITPDETRAAGPVWALRAYSSELLPLWRRLRGAHDRSGLWPVLIGTDFDGFAQSVGTSLREDIVAEGRTVDVAAALAGPGDGSDAPPRASVDAGVTPGDDLFHLEREPGWIALVRAGAGYAVPGLLNWDGAVNHDIGPALHVGILKQWHDRFGAEPVGLSRDVLELSVPRPPTDPAEVLAVAEQQYRYCPDIVDQGFRSLDRLMAVQVRAHRWFFWWD